MQTLQLKNTVLPLEAGWDVIVAGGGPAGSTAAIAAARSGKKVLLLEATGALGGMATVGLVPAWCPFTDGRQIIYRGLAEKIFRLSKKATPFVPEEKNDWVPIEPEALKRIYDDLLAEAGVHVRFQTFVAAVEMEKGRVTAVVSANKRGLTACSAKVYIDCTGDADIAAWAGAPWEKGDDAGELQPGTLCFQLSNVNTDAYEKGCRPWGQELRKLADHAKFPDLGDLHLCNNMSGPGTVGFNAGHVWGVDNTDPESVSRAMAKGRQIAECYRRTAAHYYPDAFKNAYLSSTAQLMGIRETRRITGDYVLTIEDYLARRSFDDEIVRNAYPIDIHTGQKEIEAALAGEIKAMGRYENYKAGESHGIPYRCMIPKKVENLLVAGRSISTDRTVQGSTRVMPVCLVLGEAAGIAAAMACQAGGDVRSVDTAELRGEMRKRGAYLP